MKHFSYIIFCIHFYTIVSYIVKYTFQQNFYHNFIVKICINSPLNCFPFKLSTTTNHIFVFNSKYYKGGFNPDLSNTMTIMKESVDIFHNTNFTQGNYAYDNLYIKDTRIELKSIKFILVDKGFNCFENYKGIIGLGSEKINGGNDISFIDSLVSNSIIEQKLFSIGKYTFIIGNENKKEEKLEKKCKMKEKQGYFDSIGCEIKSVFYSGNNIFIFDTSKINFVLI